MFPQAALKFSFPALFSMVTRPFSFTSIDLSLPFFNLPPFLCHTSPFTLQLLLVILPSGILCILRTEVQCNFMISQLFANTEVRTWEYHRDPFWFLYKETFYITLSSESLQWTEYILSTRITNIQARTDRYCGNYNYSWSYARLFMSGRNHNTLTLLRINIFYP